MSKKEKKIKKVVKLRIPGGAANPSPPVGPACGAAGVPIMDFCKQFNDLTKDRKGVLMPVSMTVYADNSFSLQISEPPMTYLLKKELNIDKGSSEPNKNKVSEINDRQLGNIYEIKKNDLRGYTKHACIQMILGSARSIGIKYAGGQYDKIKTD